MKGKDLIRGIVIALAICCQIYGFFTALVGECTPAPNDGSGIINEGVNMNDAVKVMQANNEDVFVLGRTCVQRFDGEGNFIKGAYFRKNHVKETSGTECMSFCNGQVIVFDNYGNKIVVFDENFNAVKSVSVSDNYKESDFYSEYPNEAEEGDNIKLTLFNTLKVGEEKIKLDAPRNFFMSRNFGFIILICAISVLLYMFRDRLDGIQK